MNKLKGIYVETLVFFIGITLFVSVYVGWNVWSEKKQHATIGEQVSSPDSTHRSLPLNAKALEEKNLTVGEMLDLEDRTITVDKIERNWDRAESILFPGTVAEAKSYYEVALVQVTVKNKSDKSSLKIADGFIKSSPKTIGVYGLKGSKPIPRLLGNEVIPPGRSFIGNLALYIDPQSPEESYVGYGLDDDSGFWSRTTRKSWKVYGQWTIVPAALPPAADSFSIKVNSKSIKVGARSTIGTFGRNTNNILFLVLDVTIQNKSNEDRSLSSVDGSFIFEDKDGVSRQLEENIDSVKDELIQLTPKRLKPGESIAGNLIFSQPQEPSGKLIWGDNILDI